MVDRLPIGCDIRGYLGPGREFGLLSDATAPQTTKELDSALDYGSVHASGRTPVSAQNLPRLRRRIWNVCCFCWIQSWNNKHTDLNFSLTEGVKAFVSILYWLGDVLWRNLSTVQPAVWLHASITLKSSLWTLGSLTDKSTAALCSFSTNFHCW